MKSTLSPENTSTAEGNVYFIVHITFGRLMMARPCKAKCLCEAGEICPTFEETVTQLPRYYLPYLSDKYLRKLGIYKMVKIEKQRPKHICDLEENVENMRPYEPGIPPVLISEMEGRYYKRF